MTSIVCNDLNNNEVNINMHDSSVNSDTFSDKIPADFYDNSIFQNVQVHNNNDSQSEEIA